MNKENRSLDVGIIHIDEDTHEVYIRDELIQLSNKEYLLSLIHI